MNRPASNLAVTIGDPAGIGPEIILKASHALGDRLRSGALKLTVIGETESFARAARTIGIEDWRGALGPGTRFVECAAPMKNYAFGQVGAEFGRIAYLAIERAVDMVSAGEADAIVTAPLNKEALNLAGHQFSGHTEILAKLTGAADSFMMLSHGTLRVTHVTTHVPLARVSALVTPARITRVVEVTNEMLRDLGIARPRLALSALNPHAGEGGVIGTEDRDVLEPTVAALRARGFDIVGPLPGDTVFVRAAAGQFDCVIANYHDQGHIPVKLLGFKVDSTSGRWTGLSGVNITLGLPIIRITAPRSTSPARASPTPRASSRPSTAPTRWSPPAGRARRPGRAREQQHDPYRDRAPRPVRRRHIRGRGLRRGRGADRRRPPGGFQRGGP